MTLRAVCLGLLLGIAIAAVTYFNDVQIKQTLLVSHHLPIAVFGPIVLLMIAVNPLLRRWRAGAALRGGEIGVIAAIALAACAWPSFDLLRGFVANVALPAHWVKRQPHWASQRPLSYVPGGSSEVAAGHVRDWPGLVGWLASGRDDVASPAGRVWSRLDPVGRQWLLDAEAAATVPRSGRTEFLHSLNRVLQQGDLHDPAMFGLTQPPTKDQALALNRRWLVDAASPHVAPAPAGEGWLAAGGRDEPLVIDPLMEGYGGPGLAIAHVVAWRTWWPTLRLWGGAALALGLASLCLAVIVHPQWSQRELLPYPIARFLGELTPSALPGEEARRGALAHRGFWVALILMLAIHSINGLQAWFPELPMVKLQLNFQPLRQLFPNASRTNQGWQIFSPRIYPSVIAFTFFLSVTVSLSLGLSTYVYVAVAAWMLSRGSTFEGEYIGAGPTNLLRLGAYMGVAMMILYSGRSHYGRVLGATLGLSGSVAANSALAWAGRGLIVSTIGAAALLAWSGMPALWAALFVFAALLSYLVLARITAETGVFYIQPWWLPVGVITALFGAEAVGPTGYITLALASIVLIGDPRTCLMPYLTNGLKMADQPAGAPPARVAPWLIVMLLLTLLVAGAMTFELQHRFGIAGLDNWARQTLPSMPFDRLAQLTSDLDAVDELAAATDSTGWGIFSRISPQSHAVRWLLLGVALAIVTAALRLRFTWWPIHPVLFLIWGSDPAGRFCFSFMLGWLIKTCVIQTVGARGHSSVLPVMVGVIAGELLAALLWAGVAAVYFALTGVIPPAYAVFP